jgi:hypothetical protein
MRRLIIVIALFVFSLPVYAETAAVTQPEQKHEMKHQCGMMGEGMKMQGMPMMPMCQQMMGQGIIMRDMMHLMMDIMKTQQRIIRGIRHDDKRDIIAELDKMMERMDKMMSDSRCPMMKGTMEPNPSPAAAPAEPKKDAPAKEEPAKSDPHKH